MVDPQQLSEILRTEGGLYLWCRRGLILTSFVAIICMMIVGLFQFGITKTVPEPSLPRLDADKVDAAPEAYNRMGLPMPDAFLGILSYAVTLALVAIGSADRFRTLWWLPAVLGVKVLIDAVQAGRLTWEQWSVHGAFCMWCLFAALATWVAVPLAAPETLAAVKHAFGWGTAK